VWRWESDAFGTEKPEHDDEEDDDHKDITVNLRFAGQYFDAESGLTYNGARYYDSRTGRFITADPRGINEHVAGYMADLRTGAFNRPPLELNPYAYVVNNPLRWIDPTGEATAVAGCAAGAWAGPWGCGAGAAIATGLTLLGGAAILSGDTPKQCKDDDDKCEKLYETDTATCNGISRVRGKAAGAKCHASASQRYAACLRGQPLPPLDTWNN
jgi:RHS repeat-associated protein